MKNSKITWILFLITFIMMNFSGTSGLMAQPGVNISFQTFYDELQPYGQWINDPDDGKVWIPDVEQDFRPYATRGHWVITDYGNTWVSDYQWGWAPFHYGRWREHSRYGWVWVPGSEWGPAWVSWRSGGGYYGWAPLGPRVNISIGINLPLHSWVFVPQRYLCSPVVYRYYEPRPGVVNIYHNTTIINNIYRYNNRNYVYGPRPYEIERATRRPVQVYRVTDAGRPGNTVVRNGSVNIYRPNVIIRSNPSGNDGQGRNNPDNRGRPAHADGGTMRSTDSRADGTLMNSSGSRSAQNNIPNRVKRTPEADHTPALDQNTPYRRESNYTDKRESSPGISRQQPRQQKSDEKRGEEPVRRSVPMHQQTRQQSGRGERIQRTTEQPSQRQSDSNRRERPVRI